MLRVWRILSGPGFPATARPGLANLRGPSQAAGRAAARPAQLDRRGRLFSSVTSESGIQFSNLPMVASADEVRAVHLETGRYFVKRGGKAHAEMTCSHLDDTPFVRNKTWRVATSEQCRALKIDGATTAPDGRVVARRARRGRTTKTNSRAARGGRWLGAVLMPSRPLDRNGAGYRPTARVGAGRRSEAARSSPYPSRTRDRAGQGRTRLFVPRKPLPEGAHESRRPEPRARTRGRRRIRGESRFASLTADEVTPARRRRAMRTGGSTGLPRTGTSPRA